MRKDAENQTGWIRASGTLIPLNDRQEQAIREWAADDRLWTTEETVRINLRTFARVILTHRADGNVLQHELLDLITLMPDTQTQEIVDYIMQLRDIRARRDHP